MRKFHVQAERTGGKTETRAHLQRTRERLLQSRDLSCLCACGGLMARAAFLWWQLRIKKEWRKRKGNGVSEGV